MEKQIKDFKQILKETIVKHRNDYGIMDKTHK